MLERQVHELYGMRMHRLERIQAACLQNLKFLNLLKNGYDVKELIDLAYINPSFETPYQKYIRTIEYMQKINSLCIRMYIQNHSIEVQILAERERENFLLDLEELILREKCVREFLYKQFSDQEIKKEMENQKKIMQAILEEKIKYKIEVINHFKSMIIDLHNQIAVIDYRINNQLKVVEDMMDAAFNDINLNKSYKLVFKADNGLDQMHINEGDLFKFAKIEIMEKFSKGQFLFSEIKNNIIDDFISNELHEIFSDKSFSERVKYIEDLKNENKEIINELKEDFLNKVDKLVDELENKAVSIESLFEIKHDLTEKIQSFQNKIENISDEIQQDFRQLNELNLDSSIDHRSLEDMLAQMVNESDLSEYGINGLHDIKDTSSIFLSLGITPDEMKAEKDEAHTPTSDFSKTTNPTPEKSQPKQKPVKDQTHDEQPEPSNRGPNMSR